MIESKIDKRRADPKMIFALLMPSGGWGLLWAVTYGATFALAPYDTSWNNYWGWPEGGLTEGGLPRQINSFFETSPGAFVPATLIVTASILLYAAASAAVRDLQESQIRLCARVMMYLLTTSAALIFVPMVAAIIAEVTSIQSIQTAGYARSLVLFGSCLPILAQLLTVQYRQVLRLRAGGAP